jgi:tRNA threonylcarbamoyladenosine biosynthesis protein TsaB
MLILAFDTTSEHGGAGIFRDKECLALAPNTGPANRYSVTLYEMADSLVRELRARAGFENLALCDVELFAAANGPGSFTGIRVGLAAAQAWSKAFGRPARGVSVLEAMIEAAGPNAEYAVPVLDARRGEFYLGMYRRGREQNGSKFLLEGEARVLGPKAARAALDDRRSAGADFVCVVRAEDEATRKLLDGLPEPPTVRPVRGSLVPAIARLALAAERTGSSPSTSTLDAYYIRRSDAELHWKE